MRIYITLILLFVSFNYTKASDRKSVEAIFRIQLNRILKISSDQNSKLKIRVAQLMIELKKLNHKVNSFDREFLIKNKRLFFEMSSTRSYLEVYLETGFSTINCKSYRMSVIHGFSPRNPHPQTDNIPSGALFSLRVLANLCENDKVLDFTPENE